MIEFDTIFARFSRASHSARLTRAVVALHPPRHGRLSVFQAFTNRSPRPLSAPPPAMCPLKLVASRLRVALFVTFLAAPLIAFAQETRPDAADQQKEEERDLPRQRAEWFYGQRAYPHSHVPAFARLRALQERERLKVDALAQGGTLSWSFDGPQHIATPYTDPVVSGRVTAIAVNPTNNSNIYAGTEGGLWETTNGGSTWTPLTDTQASLAVGSIAIDPKNSKTIYIGTGEEDFSGDSYYGAGILKSVDGGNTWSHYCGPFCGPSGAASFYGGGARIGSLSISPSNSQTLLAGILFSGVDGVYRSTDGGQTWTQTLAGNPASSVQFDPTNGNIAWATLGNVFNGGTSGVYRSTDGGLTWTAANGTGSNVINTADAARIVLKLDPSTTSTVYASVASIVDGSLLGFYKSTDSGAKWTRETSIPDYCTPQCSFDNTIAIQPSNPNVIYAGGAYTTTIVRSLDGGATWTTLQSAQNFGFLHADVHALVFTPDGTKLLLGCDGGAYDTTQITAAAPVFTAVNSLGTALFYPGMSISNSNASIALVGSQDNGTLLYSGNQTWNDVECGDGAATAIDPLNAKTMYAACNQIAIYKSTAGGIANSWTLAQNGIDTSDPVDFIPPLAIDPSNGSNLYFGTFRLYQTTNGASSWTAISPDLTTDNGFWSVVTSIAVAPTDSNTVYVGTGDSQVQVTKSANLGAKATWTNVSAGLPPRIITQVAGDPTSSTTAYVTFSGFSGFGDSLGHVFKTTSGGTDWTDISGNLPNDPVNSIVVDPDSPSSIFVGTDTGVYYTTNNGTSWTALVDGLPIIPVMSLAIYDPARVLRAATFGRGAWNINFATLLPVLSLTSLSPTSAAAGGAGFTLTVNGIHFDATSRVEWNGVALTTSFVNSGQLTATVPAAKIAAAGTAQISVFDSSTNKTSNPLTFAIDSPAPVLVSLSPTNAIAGGAAFTLKATGSEFVSGATVTWNGSARTTTFVSSTLLTAKINAADIATAGTASVTVVNPAPGGRTSSLTYDINNPLPALTALSPASKTKGSAAFTLTVNGTGFVKGAAVRWNGSPRTTTFKSLTQLTATINTADVATAGTFPVTVKNPGPGGGLSNSETFTVDNPKPGLTSLSPTSAIAGGAALTLTANGTNFVNTATVNWMGSARTTTYVSSTKLTATINASDISKAGTFQVTVTNPGLGGGTSPSNAFSVDNPVPALASISPNSATHGGASFTLTAAGTGFVPGSAIQWNGSNLPTTFVGSKSLTATVPSADIKTAGTAAVKVFNPALGGGTSGGATFTIK